MADPVRPELTEEQRAAIDARCAEIREEIRAWDRENPRAAALRTILWGRLNGRMQGEGDG
jgi:hypothetical protein